MPHTHEREPFVKQLHTDPHFPISPISQNGTPTPNDPWHRLMLRLPDKTQDPLNNKRFSPAEHSKFFGATPSPHFQSPSVQ